MAKIGRDESLWKMVSVGEELKLFKTCEKGLYNNRIGPDMWEKQTMGYFLLKKRAQEAQYK